MYCLCCNRAFLTLPCVFVEVVTFNSEFVITASSRGTFVFNLCWLLTALMRMDLNFLSNKRNRRTCFEQDCLNCIYSMSLSLSLSLYPVILAVPVYCCVL